MCRDKLIIIPVAEPKIIQRAPIDRQIALMVNIGDDSANRTIAEQPIANAANRVRSTLYQLSCSVWCDLLDLNLGLCGGAKGA